MIGYVKKENTTDERFYFIKDHLGSVRLTLNGSGVESGKDYYSYGSILRNVNYGEAERYDFTEKERDAETGLHYFGARYYDSDISNRWLSVDPLADLNPGVSPYNYAMNNPLRLIDPDGMDTLYFDSRGRYLSDKTRKGDGDHVGYYTNSNGKLVGFRFNDQSDAASILSSTGSYSNWKTNVDGKRISGINLSFQNTIDSQVGTQALSAKLSGSPLAYVAVSSFPDGAMDYYTKMGNDVVNNVSIIGNTGYNAKDAGNYMWGATMSLLGFSSSQAKFAAQMYERVFKQRNDSPNDQRAIGNGTRRYKK